MKQLELIVDPIADRINYWIGDLEKGVTRIGDLRRLNGTRPDTPVVKIGPQRYTAVDEDPASIKQAIGNYLIDLDHDRGGFVADVTGMRSLSLHRYEKNPRTGLYEPKLQHAVPDAYHYENGIFKPKHHLQRDGND